MESQDLNLIDRLTGVPNHRAFMKQLDAAVEGAARKKESLSLAVFDVDYFKNFNIACVRMDTGEKEAPASPITKSSSVIQRLS